MIHFKIEKRDHDDAVFVYMTTGSFKKNSFKMRTILFMIPERTVSNFHFEKRRTRFESIWFLLTRRWKMVKVA